MKKKEAVREKCTRRGKIMGHEKNKGKKIDAP
jgi:hypothetical protein